jgi:histidinol-phosphate aminotransferase
VSDPLRHVKPAVRALRAYTLAVRESRVKLDQNESPWDLPQAVKRRVMEKALARPWSRYPPFSPAPFLEKLAAHAGWRADGVLAGNGSNELIEALLLVTVGEGTRVVIPEPTFTLYALMTGILGGDALRVPLAADLGYDAAALARARRESAAALTIVCSPNNPTGGALPLDAIAALCEEGDGLVVVDEAYGEFAGASAVPLLERHSNLVVLRTFSKALGLAGLRVGYLLASPELVREVNKARLPYNLNFFSQLAAEAALEERALLAERSAALVSERERLRAALEEIPGVRPFPSLANFVLVELESAGPKAVHGALAERGILVRDVSGYPRLGRHLRVSVGTPEENDALLEALPAVLAACRAETEVGS